MTCLKSHSPEAKHGDLRRPLSDPAAQTAPRSQAFFAEMPVSGSLLGRPCRGQCSSVTWRKLVCLVLCALLRR